MAPKVEYKKCTECCKVLLRPGKSLECYKCNKSLHSNCSRLDKNRFLKYIQGNLEFVCQFCTDYTCCHCNKHVYYRQKAILCDVCQNWTQKNVQDSQYINILGSQLIVMKLGNVGPANHKCFLSSV